MLSENVKLFEANYPDWIDKLNEASVDSSYQITKTKSGDITLSVEKENKVFLFHSQYYPKREALKLLESAVKEEPEVLILGGFGLGYIVEEALKRFDQCKIVICDIDWVILKIALENRVLSHVFAHPRVHFLFTENSQALIEILKSFKTHNIQLIIHQPSEQLYPEYYKKLKTTVDNYQNTSEINTATLNRFQKLWTKNILKNLIDYISHKGIQSIFDQFTGIPCVIVAAGPSLSKNIELLKEVKGNGIIIAVDTVFQILQAHEIDPDFVIAVDPQDINKKYFENLRESKAILVCEPSISPMILRLFKGRKLMLGSVFHLAKWLEDLTHTKGNIEIGGSVATAAFGLALKLGFDPITFIGLDLAYSNGQTHMKGAYFEENWFYTTDRFQNIHSLTRDFLKKHGLFDVKGYDNDVVKSDRKFMMFQKWLESQFNITERTIIDATEGGAYKNNCKLLPFKEVIAQYFTKCLNLKHLDNDVYEENHMNLLEKVLGELELVLSSFNRLKEDAKRGKHLSEELYNLISKLIKNQSHTQYRNGRNHFKRVKEIHRQLDAIDQIIVSDNNLNALISITIQNIINEIDNNSDTEMNTVEKENKDLKVAKQSLTLYEGILEGVQFNLTHFDKAIKRTKKSLNLK